MKLMSLANSFLLCLLVPTLSGAMDSKSIEMPCTLTVSNGLITPLQLSQQTRIAELENTYRRLQEQFAHLTSASSSQLEDLRKEQSDGRRQDIDRMNATMDEFRKQLWQVQSSHEIPQLVQGMVTEDLFEAVKLGHIPSIEILHYNRGDQIFEKLDARGYLPLHWAARYGKAHVVDYLIKRRVKLDELGGVGKTPLYLSMHYASDAHDATSMLLINSRADMNKENTKGRYKTIFGRLLCKNRYLDNERERALFKKASPLRAMEDVLNLKVNSKNFLRSNKKHGDAMRQHVFERLLAVGLVGGTECWTSQMVRMVRTQDYFLENPGHSFFQHECTNTIIAEVMRARDNKWLEWVLDRYAEKNVKLHPTELHRAASFGAPGALKILLQKGKFADINSEGQRAIHIAALHNASLEIIQLFQAGARFAATRTDYSNRQTETLIRVLEVDVPESHLTLTPALGDLEDLKQKLIGTPEWVFVEPKYNQAVKAAQAATNCSIQ